MVATESRSFGAGAPPAPNDDGNQVIHPRRGLPGGRAVVGGFLIAVAAVGIFGAVSGAGRGPATRYVVAAHHLDPGRIVQASDLRSVAIDLPSAQARTAFRHPDQLVGTVVLAPVATGALVPSSALADAGDDPIPTLALALDTADAVGGGLIAGDTVDVYVTYGSDRDAETTLVAPGARVVGAGDDGDAVTDAGQADVVLAVADPDERIALVNGAGAGHITLVRTTGAEGARAGQAFSLDGADTASLPRERP